MAKQTNHKAIIQGFYKQFQGIFENSGQAMYAYLDDDNIVCNKKFSTMLGYSTPQAWAKTSEPFLAAFVDSKSQISLANTYQKAMNNLTGASIPVTWKTKTGKKVSSNVILVPVIFKDHVLALHFITKK